MLRKKNSEPAQQPDAQQELLDFENPAAQPDKKDPKQFLKHNWKKITAVIRACCNGAKKPQEFLLLLPSSLLWPMAVPSQLFFFPATTAAPSAAITAYITAGCSLL